MFFFIKDRFLTIFSKLPFVYYGFRNICSSTNLLRIFNKCPLSIHISTRTDLSRDRWIDTWVIWLVMHITMKFIALEFTMMMNDNAYKCLCSSMSPSWIECLFVPLCLQWPLNSPALCHSCFDWVLCVFNLWEPTPEKIISEVSIKGKYPCFMFFPFMKVWWFLYLLKPVIGYWLALSSF